MLKRVLVYLNGGEDRVKFNVRVFIAVSSAAHVARLQDAVDGERTRSVPDQ